MPKLLANTTVLDGFTPRVLLAGEELPAWAKGKVGDHLLSKSTRGRRKKPAEPTQPQETQEPDNDPEDLEPEEALEAEEETEELTEEETSAEPDFTKPAPKRKR